MSLKLRSSRKDRNLSNAESSQVSVGLRKGRSRGHSSLHSDIMLVRHCGYLERSLSVGLRSGLARHSFFHNDNVCCFLLLILYSLLVITPELHNGSPAELSPKPLLIIL